MKIRSIILSLSVLASSLLLITTGCGPQATNQNTAVNQNATVVAVNSNANKSANSEDAMRTITSTCTNQDDAQIEKQIWILIQSDPRLKTQIRHINLDSKYCTVTLHGWTDGWEDFKKLYEIVYNAPGVRKIDISGFGIARPTVMPRPSPESECPSGTHPCGELCIPIKDDCTQPGGGGTKIDATPSPAATPRP